MDITLCLSRHQQPPGAPKKIQFGFQIDSILTQISAPGTLSPPPEVPGNPEKRLLVQFLPDIGARFGIHLTNCVRERFFSSVFRMTVAARAGR